MSARRARDIACPDTRSLLMELEQRGKKIARESFDTEFSAASDIFILGLANFLVELETRMEKRNDL